MAKKGNKNDQGPSQEDMIDFLSTEIKLLETKIFLEEQKELDAIKELELIIKQTTKEKTSMDDLRNEEGKKIIQDNEDMSKQQKNYDMLINEAEKEIKELDEDIRNQKNQIVEYEKYTKEELDKRDNQIAELQSQREQMSIRFQQILQKTANKLQERVEMGR
jgi:hypothetical protein